MRAARAADRAVKRGAKLGLLCGVPLAHKDMFYRAGQVCDAFQQKTDWHAQEQEFVFG